MHGVVQYVMLASLLLGLVLSPQTAVAQKTFTLVGLADCGATSGQRCRFPDTGAVLTLISNDSGSPQRYSILLDWVAASLPDIDQDDQLSVEVQVQPGGDLLATSVLNVSGASGLHNPGRSTGSVEAREQTHPPDDDDSDARPVIEDAAGENAVSESQFEWLGPDNFAGRIRSVLVHPTNANIIYAGAATGGVWKSTNGGQSWVSLDDFMPTQVIGSLAMDPNDPNTIYAGTGEIFTFLAEGLWLRGQDRGQGIFVTRDAGLSWRQLASTTGPDWLFVSRIAISPADSQVILAATSTGLFRTTNGGGDFPRVLNGNFLDVKFHPSFNPRLPANTNAIAAPFGAAPQFSTNGGATWTTSASTAVFTNGTRVELAPVTQAPTEWRALHIDRSSEQIKLMTSTDRGQNFSFVAGGAVISCDSNPTGVISNNGAYTGGLWVDPRDSRKLLVGGVDLCRSTDGGQSFTEITGLGSDFHAIVQQPSFSTTNNRILIGHDQGLRRLRDYDTSPVPESLNNGLRTTQFHSAVADPTSGNVVGGTQDTGTLARIGTAWRQLISGDGIMASRGSNIFYFGKSIGRVFRSFIDGSGVECFSATSTAPIGESLLSGSGECGTNPVSPFCGNKTPVLVDPNDITRLYVGCRQLWRTQGARTASPANIIWTPINWTGATPPTVNFIINAMDIPRGDANLMWVGTMHAFGGSDPSAGVAGQLWRSTNAATNAPTFTQMNIGKGLPARPVFDVAIDPRPDATGKFQKVYVSYSGFAPDNVWMTPDDGASWSPIGAGLPAVPVWAIAVHPTKPGWLYAGTDVGLYTSTDDGATWSATTRGPATVAIADLQWKDNTRLTVATYGRGVHEFNATPNPELLFPESAQVPFGALIRGRVENLLLSDDKRLVLSKPTRPQDLSAVLTTRGGFTTSATPVGSNVEFSIESLASQDVDQTLEWFDFLNSQFVTMQIVRLTAGQERTTNRFFADGASRFISPTTRQLQARLTWTPVTTGSTFSVEIDAARWRITRP